MSLVPPDIAAVDAPGRAGRDTPADRRRGIALVAVLVLGSALRLGALGRHPLNLDESFTATVARRPLPDLLDVLRHADSHPPLDYLLRVPLARAGASDLVLRLPSAGFSVAALVLFGWWMRGRGWFGVLATLLMAISGYQLFYGREARMYALLELLGVAAAMTSSAWLAHPSRRGAIVVGAVVLLAVFDHVSGLVLAAGLGTVPGLRRDRDAWEWRAAVAVPVVVWAALWGPALMDQRRHDHTFAPPTSWSALAHAVGGQVTTLRGTASLALVAVVLGVVALRTVDAALFRVAIPCAVVPIGAAAVIGVATPVLISRFLVCFGWIVPVAVAAAVVWIGRRSRPVATLVTLLVLLAVGASAVHALRGAQPVDRAMARLRAVARPGDVVAVSPAWYGPLVEWNLGVHGTGDGWRVVRVRGLADSFAIAVATTPGSGPPSGRVWLLEPVDHDSGRVGAPCGPEWTDGVSRVRCVSP